jgi:hypothetical protein
MGRTGAGFLLAVTMSFGLTGCTSGAGTESAARTPSPTTTSTATRPADTIDLRFDASPAAADGITAIEWAVPLAVDERFAVLSPDDGSGNWSYTDTSNGCRLVFFQGQFTDVLSAADDRTSTDAVLLAVFGASDASVTPEVIDRYTEDARVSMYEAEGSADVRVFGGQGAAGGSQADIARRFGTLGLDFYLSITCPPGERDAFTEFDELVDGELIALFAHVAE